MAQIVQPRVRVPLEELMFVDPDDDWVPGMYADKLSLVVMVLSVMAFLTSGTVWFFEGIEQAIYYIMAANYFGLLYIALEQK